jgi:hypothetical protein
VLQQRPNARRKRAREVIAEVKARLRLEGIHVVDHDSPALAHQEPPGRVLRVTGLHAHVRDRMAIVDICYEDLKDLVVGVVTGDAEVIGLGEQLAKYLPQGGEEVWQEAMGKQRAGDVGERFVAGDICGHGASPGAWRR